MEPVSKLHLDDVKWYHDPTAGDSIPTCCLHSYTLSVLTALNAQEGEVDPVWGLGASNSLSNLGHEDMSQRYQRVRLVAAAERRGERRLGVDYHSRLWHEEA